LKWKIFHCIVWALALFCSEFVSCLLLLDSW
jgi:hypothetical protein